MPSNPTDAEKVASVIRDAGGRLVGRTRLQKTICLLELANEPLGFHFDYHHYGPYCEEVAKAAHAAAEQQLITEQSVTAEWGGTYSVYTTPDTTTPDTSLRSRLIRKSAGANAVVLELAATAAFLGNEGIATPWEETARRKPGKADDGRLEEAKTFYRELREIAPNLPQLA